ncbi:hypothetical protein CEXT_554841 [Caerostris extrusa]|uniref:Uncharacterized protein n=1 Tax=Caerostris extrusa TaxID=172846 RepID=A0AAV4U4X4_CAEEX|nr:hypothetical protein CEXT_554841 [Caerostris extrusa]
METAPFEIQSRHSIIYLREERRPFPGVHILGLSLKLTISQTIRGRFHPLSQGRWVLLSGLRLCDCCDHSDYEEIVVNGNKSRCESFARCSPKAFRK